MFRDPRGIGVVRAKYPLPVGQCLLEQGKRIGGPTGLPVGERELFGDPQGAGVVRAEYSLVVGQGLVVQRGRLGAAAGSGISGSYTPQLRPKSRDLRTRPGLSSHV